MKVTALIPDDIVNDVRKLAGGKNITESIIVALKEWTALKKIKQLNNLVEDSPLQFDKNYSAQKARDLNRKR